MEKQLKTLQLKGLKPYENNPKNHSKNQIEQIRRSIAENGFIAPIIVDENYMILAGHGRYLAAKAEKLKEVPCVVVTGLTEAQKKGYIIADNKLAEGSTWNNDLLKAELDDLIKLDFDLDLTGFRPQEIDNIFAENEPQSEESKGDWKFMAMDNVNVWLPQPYEVEGEFDIPIVQPCEPFPKPLQWIPFSKARNFKGDCKRYCVHFFEWDYQWTAIWSSPNKYISLLKRFGGVCMPDYSVFSDFPKAMRIFYEYRKHWLAAYWQSKGIKVLPLAPFEMDGFSNAGMPLNSCYVVSNYGYSEGNSLVDYAKQEQMWNEFIKTYKPTKIYLFGKILPYQEPQKNIVEAWQCRFNKTDKGA